MATLPVQAVNVAFSSDGSRIVSGDWGRSVRIWDAATGSELLELQGHEDAVNCVLFGPDDLRVVSAGNDGTVRVWETGAGTEARTLRGHTANLKSVSFGEADTRIFSESSAKFVPERFVWDSATGQRIDNAEWPKTLPEQKTSDDGRWLLLSSRNDVLLVDRDFRNTPREKAYREAKASSKSWFHRVESQRFMSEQKWYAATFHSAQWLLSSPDSKVGFDQLHEAWEKLEARFQKIVPDVVNKALALPEPTESPSQ